MNKKHLYLLLIFFGCLGVVVIFSYPAYSQTWNPPSSEFLFPSKNEIRIFDEGTGPGVARVSPLIFSRHGQVINLKAGQTISDVSGNARIVFGSQGISIVSLSGPLSFNTKGIILRDMNTHGTSVITPATGTIARFGNTIKYNTGSEWKDSSEDEAWKRGENNSIYYEGVKSEPGWFYLDTRIRRADGTFSFIKKAQAVEIDPCEPDANAPGCTRNGGGGSGGGSSGGGSGSNPTAYNVGRKLTCDTSNTIRDCPLDFIPDSAGVAAGTRGHDLFVEDGVTKAAVYEYVSGVLARHGSVVVGATTSPKNLVINGSLKVDGKFSFSQKKVFRSDQFKFEPGGNQDEMKEYIIKDSSGNTNFSFCALGSRWIDAGANSSCTVFYDVENRHWKMRLEKWGNSGVACRANCF